MYCIRNRITNYIFSFHKREMKIQWYNSLIQFSICSERRCHWKSQTLLHDSFGNKYVHRPLVSQSKPNTGSRPHNSLSYLKGKKCLSNVKSPNLHPPPPKFHLFTREVCNASVSQSMRLEKSTKVLNFGDDDC